jgi:hypothetical protein
MLEGDIGYWIGTWEPEEEDEPSNLREFENMVAACLREEEAKSHLEKALIFMCTDNFTVESVIVKGSSSSEKLLALALEVRQIKMRARARRLVVSHVSGERMRTVEGGCVNRKGHAQLHPFPPQLHQNVVSH